MDALKGKLFLIGDEITEMDDAARGVCGPAVEAALEDVLASIIRLGIAYDRATRGRGVCSIKKVA